MLWPQTAQGRRRAWLSVLTLFLASPFFVREFVSTAPSVCTFRNLTGQGCPGCGLTRSVCALSEGRLLDSLRLHVCGPLVYLIALGAWGYYLAALIRDREPLAIEPRHVTRVWLGMLIFMIGYWIVRILMGAVP